MKVSDSGPWSSRQSSAPTPTARTTSTPSKILSRRRIVSSGPGASMESPSTSGWREASGRTWMGPGLTGAPLSTDPRCPVAITLGKPGTVRATFLPPPRPADPAAAEQGLKRWRQVAQTTPDPALAAFMREALDREEALLGGIFSGSPFLGDGPLRGAHVLLAAARARPRACAGPAARRAGRLAGWATAPASWRACAGPGGGSRC